MGNKKIASRNIDFFLKPFKMPVSVFSSVNEIKLCFDSQYFLGEKKNNMISSCMHANRRENILNGILKSNYCL